MQIKNKILKLKELFSIFIRPFSLAFFFVSLFLYLFKSYIIFPNTTFILSIGISLGFLFFFLWFKKLGKTNLKNKIIVQTSQILFSMSLLLTTILNLNFFKIQNIPQHTNLLTTLVFISSGFIFLYTNKQNLQKNELSSEQNHEKLPEKFSKIDKIPIIKNILRWFYKEGLIYSISLTLILLLAFILRYSNLTILDPYTDEYLHLVGAKDLLKTGNTTYTRALLVTYLVKTFYIIGHANSFYEYLFWGRLPGVIFSSITIIPLYSLTKRINKNIGIISAGLLAISPWAIGVSRTIREYAYYPFFILTSCLLLIKLIELIIDYKKEKIIKMIIYFLSLFAICFYAYFIDTLSTLKIIFLLFPVITLYFVFQNLKTLISFFKLHKKVILTIISFILILIFFLLETFTKNNIKISPNLINFENTWINYFFDPKIYPMQWWYNTNYIYIVFLFLILSVTYSLLQKKKEGFLYILVFGSILICFSFFFSRYLKPRYIYYNLFFFIPIISMGIYLLTILYTMFASKTQKIFYISCVILFLLNFFNLSNTIYSFTSDKHGYVAMTNENHDRVKETIQFLKNEIKPDDVFITTIFGSILQLEFNIDKEKNYNYTYNDPERFNAVKEIIKNHKQGLMILDSRRNGNWSTGYSKTENFYIDGILVKVLQNKDGIQIYRWQND